MRFAVWLLAAALQADVAAIREMVRAGRFDEAVTSCERELKVAPGNAALWTLKGLALRGAGRNPDALAALRRAIALAPTGMAALQAAAQIEFETGDARAAGTLNAIVKLEPGNGTAHAMLAELAFRGGDCEGAVRHYARAGTAPEVRWRMGGCLFQLERWSEAAAQFAALLALREHDATRYNLALSWWRAGDAAKAWAAIEPLRREDRSAMSLKAAILRARGDVPGALALLDRGVREHPQDEDLLMDLAVLCLDQNSVDLGIRVLEAGAGRLPGSARVAMMLGVFLVRAGRAAEGEAKFAAAARLAPGSAMGAVGAAMTLMELGRPEEAVRLLRAQASVEPMVGLTLARALVQKSPSAAERSEARGLLSGLTAREPGNVAAWVVLGRVESLDGNRAQAVRCFERALAINGEERTAAYQLMLLYRALGRAADATRMSARVREMAARDRQREAVAERYKLSAEP